MDPSLAHLMSWAEGTKGDIPEPLTGPSITISPLPAPHLPTVFLFAGKYVHNRKLTDEMWAMDLNTRVWEKLDPGPGPGPRYFHSMDVWEDKFVCFGGMSDAETTAVHNDIWFFDCRTRKWIPQSPSHDNEDPVMMPSPRYAHLSAVSRGKLLISGGQHSDNSWIYELNVYDLKNKMWLSKTRQPDHQGQHSKGAYRSVAVSSKQRVIQPPQGKDGETGYRHSYSIAEEGEGGEILCYSNYDFAKVRRELDVISPLIEGEVNDDPSDKYEAPPSFTVHDQSNRMLGSSQPPGLRFPAGGVVGNHFILCGLYLASSSAAFSIWSLDLTTMVWRHLEPAVLHEGSWNRAVIWPERAKLLVFGNSSLDLAADYGKRAVNVDHMAIISLETYGIYQPPQFELPSRVQERGLHALDDNVASDFEIVADDGRKVRCSRQILRYRWSWFENEERKSIASLSDQVKDQPTIDIADTLLGSFEPSQLAPTSLTIPEPFPVCVALVQYFYTLSLSTALQNRAPILTSLLFLAKHYEIERLARLVVHALHERLEPSVAVGVYEIATLSGEQALQLRALTMIHSSKGGHRSHRKGPSGSLENGSSRSQTGSPAHSQSAGPHHGTGHQPNSSGQGSSSSQRAPNTVGSHMQHQARIESMTLGIEEDDPETEALLAALSSQATAQPARPEMNSLTRDLRRKAVLHEPQNETTCPSIPLPQIPTSSSSGTSSSQSPSTAPPLTPSTNLTRTTSLLTMTTSSDSPDTSFPQTPRDGQHSPVGLRTELPIVLPNRGLGFPNLPQEGGFGHSFLNHTQKSTTEARAALMRSTSLENAPPAFSGFQAQNIAQRHANVQVRDPSVQHHYHTYRELQRASFETRSITSVPESAYSVYTLDGGPLTPTTSSGRSEISHYTIRHPNLRSGISLADSASFSSDSTGGQSTESRKQAKEERKATLAAEKAMKKEEARAKFEVLRAEQLAKGAVARAEAQRKAEVAQHELPKPKPAPKSKFGRFGQQFKEAVLFPEGGKNSNYF